MQIKVNMEIRDIEDEVALGLTVRQLVCVALILICVIPLYVYLVRVLPADFAAVLSLLAGLVIGLVGFKKWHKMPFERAVLYWGYTLLCPKQIVFKGENVYMTELQVRLISEREKTNDVQKNIMGIKETPKGIPEDTEPDTGHDSSEAGI